MILTEEIQLVEEKEKTNDLGALRTCIKVKQPNGTYQTIIPITNSESVFTTSGQTVEAELVKVISGIATNDAVIEILCEDTEVLAGNMLELVNYVDPLMEQLKSHIEVVDTGNEMENNIFEHVYQEIDGIVQQLGTITKSITDINVKLTNVIDANKKLTETVNTLSSKVSTHEDTIV